MIASLSTKLRQRGTQLSCLVVLIVCVATPVRLASARVTLTFQDGRVWLSATGATVGEILAEWSRVGGTRVFNADRVASGPMTLDLKGVTEMEALNTVLRSTGGFVAATRPPDEIGDAGTSRIVRIAVMAAKTSPPEPPRRADAIPTPAAAPATRALTIDPSGARRVIGPDGQFVPDDQDDAAPPPPPPAGRGRGGRQ
jgi:hypothetical protein